MPFFCPIRHSLIVPLGERRQTFFCSLSLLGKVTLQINPLSGFFMQVDMHVSEWATSVNEGIYSFFLDFSKRFYWNIYDI